MVLIESDSVAVYDVTSGALLWQSKHVEPVSTELVESLSITKVFTVYWLNQGNAYLVNLFSTQTGQLMGSHEISNEMWRDSNNSIVFNEIRARGKYLCFTRGKDLFVIRVTVDKTEMFQFKNGENTFGGCMYPEGVNCDSLQSDRTKLVGFLGKSTVLLYYFPHYYCPELYGVDLNDLMEAEELYEWPWSKCESLALSSPMRAMAGKKREDPSFRYCSFYPLYRTDRRSNCVDLVGVMHQADFGVVLKHYLVTELQCKNITQR